MPSGKFVSFPLFNFLNVYYFIQVNEIKLNFNCKFGFIHVVRASGNILPHQLVSDSQNIRFPPRPSLVSSDNSLPLSSVPLGFQCCCSLVLSLTDSRTVLLHCLDQNNLTQAIANRSFEHDLSHTVISGQLPLWYRLQKDQQKHILHFLKETIAGQLDLQ